jgi:hypothetical protein
MGIGRRRAIRIIGRFTTTTITTTIGRAARRIVRRRIDLAEAITGHRLMVGDITGRARCRRTTHGLAALDIIGLPVMDITSRRLVEIRGRERLQQMVGATTVLAILVTEGRRGLRRARR